jgi:hypothetical protein
MLSHGRHNRRSLKSMSTNTMSHSLEFTTLCDEYKKLYVMDQNLMGWMTKTLYDGCKKVCYRCKIFVINLRNYLMAVNTLWDRWENFM